MQSKIREYDSKKNTRLFRQKNLETRNSAKYKITLQMKTFAYSQTVVLGSSEVIFGSAERNNS
jgi:hypothetical protein